MVIYLYIYFLTSVVFFLSNIARTSGPDCTCISAETVSAFRLLRWHVIISFENDLSMSFSMSASYNFSNLCQSREKASMVSKKFER